MITPCLFLHGNNVILSDQENKDARINYFANHYEALLPARLDLDHLLQSSPPQMKYYQKDPVCIRAGLCYIISVIVKAMIMERTDTDMSIKLKDSDYVHLYSKALQNVLSNYKQYITYLEKHGIITSNNSWSSFNNYSIGYKLTDKYAQDVLAGNIKKSTIYSRNFLNSFRKYNQPENVKKKYPYLYKWFHDLDFDEHEADRILDSVYKYERTNIRTKLKSSLYNLRNEATWTFRTGETSRLYNPISNLRKELRTALRCNGERLVEIDIKNSLPFISLIFFDSSVITKYKEVIIRFAPYLYENSNALPCFSVERNECISNLKDVQKFKEAILGKDVYKDIACMWNEFLDTRYDRKRAKAKFLEIVNSPRYIESEEKELLRTEYPNVIRVIDTINGNFCTKKRRKNKSGSYKDAPFAYITQTIESHFILDRICGGLAQELPDAPLYTIHDAIFSTAKFANEVINKIRSVSKDMFGVEARTHLSHQNL